MALSPLNLLSYEPKDCRAARRREDVEISLRINDKLYGSQENARYPKKKKWPNTPQNLIQLDAISAPGVSESKLKVLPASQGKRSAKDEI